MVWVQLQSYLHKHKKTPQEAQVARRAKNQRRLERAKEDEKTLAALKAKRARYEQRTKEKITLARTTPEENRELLEKVNEKNKAKRARKKERKRLAKKGD